MKKLNKKQRRIIETSILVAASLIIILLWDTWLVYPVKLLVVLLHEMSHGLMALLTGGKVIGLKISGNLGGTCATVGGIHVLIVSAGYLGSLAFGAALFVSAYNKKHSLWTSVILGILIILFALFYINGVSGVLFALLIAIALILSALFIPEKYHKWGIKFLGLTSIMYVITDIKSDLLTLEYRQSDAQILFGLTGIPALFWGILWFLIALTAVWFLLKYSFKKGF